ncbi:Na,H/K antiporter P-type ATPase alpha subunit family protein (macronuclear) [Tetrahymena thermophila SB210]|uniref:Na,H/K antiporter P-type ATPase alpha subunit family protein n=1 Tax=Tetrahymena thermophila (strain SB210) TaxID=312017 RepID=Q23ZA6_TETTS|nr:Na,H/K antiporter P-type ATPase alpha subunit family protein [Tetrahymena thermophila SB210]EAS01865.1 Na,H/K antiporter P-type ATPase alpha subunit family protein [Tetrahymena thermophila SB210]|eukprot:XP_001022110.1 Na,H/K antiporter P-type ATPase alpha subunit family protein [Tetrahymena thermophila SB210]
MSQTNVVRQSASGVVRKFEEMRQSIQLKNSIQEIRQSQEFQKSRPDLEEGNKRQHINCEFQETTIKTEGFMISNTQTADVAKNNVNKKLNKDQKQKQDIVEKVDHKISLEELKQKYQTDFQNGLTEQQAQELLKKYGENKLTVKQGTPLWVKLLKEMTNGFSLMLWVSAILCFIAQGLQPNPSNIYLAVVLIIVILITTAITFQQNAKSEALMNSFKNFIPAKTIVIRGGEIKQIEAVHLVVGDVVVIRIGEKIPADIRILESNEMKVDNSPLTGESEPLLRTTECSHPESYIETSNIAFFGTLCKEGNGKGIVICTGDNTMLGQIADLSSGEKKVKTPLRIELDRFVVLITVIAIVLGVAFFLLALLYMNYKVTDCLVFGIGILVANVPEGLLGCITISLAITAKNLSAKNVLVKNLEAVETLGSTSCICSDKTGTLTQNVMSVKNLWYSDQIHLSKNKAHLKQGEIPEYNTEDPDFKTLQKAAMLSSEARFDTSTIKEKENIDYLTCPVLGDATETGIIRFYQYIEDVNSFRERYRVAKNPDGTQGKMPFNSQVKFALTIIEEQTQESYYTVYIKGAPEKIWSFCSSIIVNGQPSQLNDNWQKKFKAVNLTFGKGGERVLGFAKLSLPAAQFPQGFIFNVSSIQKFPFKLTNFQFCGLISLMDPPKQRVPYAILECRSAGVKVIMVTGDQPPTAAAIAKEVNIIPKDILTNEDLMERNPSLSWWEASEQCRAIIVHGDRITESIDKALSEKKEDCFYLRQWVVKPYCVFARTTPAQKLQIVDACQKEGFIVAATGDGVNDSPAIKKADIGISMNISGSDVTKDAADMVLVDDDFASIVLGVEEGRKIFDNLKKTIVYLLTSNMTEIIPFLAFIILQIPLPLSSIYMLVICVGTDVWPAISLAYEEAELDVMTRRPRNKSEHLVSNKLITIAYLQTGQIASGAGHLGYYIAFNYFGFPVLSLFGLASATGYRPVQNDFGTYYNPQLQRDDPYYNSAIYNITKFQDCNKLSTDQNNALSNLQYSLDWFTLSEGNYDLRKSLVKCDPVTGAFIPWIKWSDCDINKSQNWSVLTSQTACYSVEAINYAQSVYFLTVVLLQWTNVFACKSRSMSFTTTAFNSVMIQGVIFETILVIFLQYVPGVQTVFGGRPMFFWLWTSCLAYTMLLLIYDELRKFCCRKSRWFYKYCYW